jgi:hypothetical protein
MSIELRLTRFAGIDIRLTFVGGLSDDFLIVRLLCFSR